MRSLTVCLFALFAVLALLPEDRAHANPVMTAGPTSSEGRFIKISQANETKRPQDIVAYGGDPQHCTIPPFPGGPTHCLPNDKLVLAYRISSTFEVRIKRRVAKGPIATGGKWQTLGNPVFLDQVTDSAYVNANGSFKFGVTAFFAQQWETFLPPWNPALNAAGNGLSQPKSQYEPADPDFVITVAGLKQTTPNADVCLSWLAGPPPEMCSSDGASDTEKAKNALAGALSKVAQGDSAPGSGAAKAHAHQNGANGQNPNDVKIAENMGYAAQGDQCCTKFLVLKVCNEGSIPILPSSKDKPDITWKAVTGITDVPSCTGTGLSGGVDYKTLYIHTEGTSSSGTGLFFQFLLDGLKNIPGGKSPYAALFKTAVSATQRVMASSGNNRKTFFEVVTLGDAFTPSLTPPVTWQNTEHTTASTCKPIDDITLPDPEEKAGSK
ncbi:MAG: hypothetical protein ACKN9R_00815 [Candidatus Limnocylindrus sp.]